MASIDDIILRSINPFDNSKSVNFWNKQTQPEPFVESIHQNAIAALEAKLNEVTQDHRTRTVLLEGDSGSGKTYLMGRLKEAFNYKAFFVYIRAFTNSDSIWRHILRYTVDSMVQVPAGQKDSQLLLWLNSVLSAIKQRSIKDRIVKDDVLDLLRTDRQKFINKLRNVYQQKGIYNADSFFGVLHDLTNPELYPLACDWLRGNDLSEESLAELKVRRSLDTEEAAREILANFGRVAAETQPIVLCFDEQENIACLPDGSLDLQRLFQVNARIHNEDNNFLVIISILTNTWNEYKNRIDRSHKARIDEEIFLKQIDLKQAEALWGYRMKLLQAQADTQPSDRIYPLTPSYLEEAFPSGKMLPRAALELGRDIFQEYKQWLFEGRKQPFKRPDGTIEPDPANLLATFNLKWTAEFTKTQKKITRIRQLSSPELIQMLKEALAALTVEGIKTPLFTGTKYASYSIGYKMPGTNQEIGVVWTEDQNMMTFFHVMEACQKAIQKNLCKRLFLIRAEGVGNPKNRGYQRYVKIFNNSPHRRITPVLTAVHYLATYYSLVKDAREGDLTLEGETIEVRKLQDLVCESKSLHLCTVLQDLEVVPKQDTSTPPDPIKEFILNLVITQKILGRHILIQNTQSEFSDASEYQINQLIQQLAQENKITTAPAKAKPEAQLVCWVPQKK